MNNLYFINTGKKATIDSGKLNISKNVAKVIPITNKVQIDSAISFHSRSNQHYERDINLQVVECDSDLNVINIQNYK